MDGDVFVLLLYLLLTVAVTVNKRVFSLCFFSAWIPVSAHLKESDSVMNFKSIKQMGGTERLKLEFMSLCLWLSHTCMRSRSNDPACHQVATSGLKCHNLQFL